MPPPFVSTSANDPSGPGVGSAVPLSSATSGGWFMARDRYTPAAAAAMAMAATEDQ
jgi:hypothetical protein